MSAIVNKKEMMKRLINNFQTYFILLIIMTGFCYGQEVNDTRIDFIRVYSTQSYLIPPFAKKEIEISNNQICHRNVLPPRQKMRKVHLDVYDSQDKESMYQNIETVDYDSIVNFIMTSGILNIDLNYTKPDTTNGVIMMISGAGSYRYVIETSDGKFVLLISGARDFKLPDILVDFDDLFNRISNRYHDKNKKPQIQPNQG